MGKNKTNKNEKKTAEFILTARPADDPDYNNPNVPQNVLLYVPKDKDDENTQKTLDNIPESIRGNTFDEETQAKLVRQRLGIEDDLDESGFNSSAFGAIKQNKDNNDNKSKAKRDRPPVLFNEEANKQLSESEGGSEDYGLEEGEEYIDTQMHANKKETGAEKALNKNNENNKNNNNNISSKDNKKPIGFKNPTASLKKEQYENLTLKDLLSGNKEKLLEIDDKTLDMLIKKSKAKIDAEVTHYNEYGLKNTVDPEVLEYVTDKKFREGVDLFIPAPNYNEVREQNRVDIDLNPDEMNADYKEVYEALNKEESEEEADDGVLEDDFILLANDGKLPIELLEEDVLNNKDEILLVDTGNAKKDPKQPSYKFITKEEKELLNKQFSKTYEQFYNDEEDEADDALKQRKNANKFTSVEEEEFEEYELSDAEMEAAAKSKEKNKNNKKTDLKSKEFNDAINELLPKKKRISNEKNESENDEDFEEEEEFEDFDENLLDDEYIRKQQELGDMESTLKYSEHLVLQEKGAGKVLKQAGAAGEERKLVEKKNLVLKTKKKLEDEETIEDMEKYLYSKEVIEMDLKVIDNMLLRDEINKEADKAKEETDPAYELNYAKKYLDITSVGGTFGNMPKVIAIEGDPKKLEKKLRKDEKIKKEKEAKLAAKSEDVKKANNNNNIGTINTKTEILNEKNLKKNKKEEFDFEKEIKAASNLNSKSINNKNDFGADAAGKELKEKLEHLDDSGIEEDESDKDEDDVNFNELEEKHKFENLNEKEANKLRKKMLKNEKREKRKLKKEIKLAFKDEKVKQSKQIANTNSVIRYGMSVKEI